MNDLEEFRAALHGPAEPAGKPAALGDIIQSGRRLRRRRRLVTATVAAAAVAVVAGGAAVALQADRPEVVAPAQGVYRPAGAWGAGVETGIQEKGGQVVIMAHRLPDQPGAFAMQTCFAGADGSLAGCVVTNDSPDKTPGFHGIEQPMTGDQGSTPLFGYFVGKADKITAKLDGKPITAQTAVWSEDPNVVFFWFPFDQYSPDAIKSGPDGKFGSAPTVSGWAATDRDGQKLPIGNPQPAFG
jgi:hypothetical protein